MSYSKTSYLALKKETTENTAVTPDVFIPLLSENIVTEYAVIASTPISASRTVNQRALKGSIPAPTGSITIQTEAKTFGHFLNGVFGAGSSGQYMPMTSASGDWAIGDTVTGGSSSTTATVAFVSSELDYLLVTSPSGSFTDGETITNGSTGTGTLTQHDATVFGHEFTAPSSSLPTYTIEIGFENEAYRYAGVRINGISVQQTDNIITAEITITARSEYKLATVTAVTSAAGGSQTITVDQTTGLVAGDSVKLYRPGTGYLDFEASSDKVHTIDSITSETAFVVTALQTSTAVGDFIVLAPQTASYSVVKEYTWHGGSLVTIDDTITAGILASGDCIEDFEFTLTNEIEPKHCADGINVVNRFPGKNFLKGLTASGSISRTYTDMEYLQRMRDNTDTAVFVRHTAGQIGSTGQYYTLEWRMANCQFDPFNANLSEDDLIGQDMPFQLYDSSGDGYLAKALLVNDVSSY